MIARFAWFKWAALSGRLASTIRKNGRPRACKESHGSLDHIFKPQGSRAIGEVECVRIEDAEDRSGGITILSVILKVRPILEYCDW